MSESVTHIVNLRPDLPLMFTDAGAGRVALILHGGGGPFTVQSIGAHLATSMRVIIPTHPGWNGAERPAWLTSIRDLALAYVRLLKSEGLRDVIVIGSSIGGWIACEMALHDDGGLIGGLALIDSGGVEIAGQPVVDVFSLTPRGIAEHSYHNPDRFYVDPATIPPELAARQRANMATMRLLAGDSMCDPMLLNRLRWVQAPTLAIWGDSDRMYTPGYGRALADAFDNARFTIIPNAGHLPHIEQPGATFAALDAFIQTQA